MNRYRITEEDYLAAQRLHLGWQAWASAAVAWGVPTAFLALIAGVGYDPALWLHLGLTSFLLALAVFVCVPLLRQWLAKKVYSADHGLREEVEVAFTDEHVQWTSPSGTASIKWADILKHKEDDRVFLLYEKTRFCSLGPPITESALNWFLRRNHVMRIVPKRAFANEDELAEFSEKVTRPRGRSLLPSSSDQVRASRGPAMVASDADLPALWRKARLGAFLFCLAEPVYVILMVLLGAVTPDMLDEGLFGAGAREFFLSFRPLLVLVCVAFAGLGLLLRRALLRQGLPPAVTSTTDTEEKLRLAFMSYLRLVRASMTIGSWVGGFGLLHFVATAEYWFAVILVASGMAAKVVFWPTKRGWARFLGATSEQIRPASRDTK